MELSKKTKSAFLICFLEGWERFSYYGMRALLVLYLTSKLGFNDVKAYSVYSLFAAIGYSVPVLAGFLADRMLGFQRTLIIGGFILCLGHLAMALTSDDPTLVYVGLSLITIGTGFFKGNVTSLLGTIYIGQHRWSYCCNYLRFCCKGLWLALWIRTSRPWHAAWSNYISGFSLSFGRKWSQSQCYKFQAL
jgi:dipeptide/tripeptide permease